MCKINHKRKIDIIANIKSLNAKYLPKLQPDICSGKNSILKDFLKEEKITFDKKTLTTLHFISKYTSHSQSGIAYMKQRTILDQLALEYLPLLSINTLKFVIKKLLKKLLQNLIFKMEILKLLIFPYLF